jgi:hypothetical protein
LWEGHSTLIHEVDRQLPNGVKPDAILCSVGGAGLLGGVLRGVNNVGWDHSKHSLLMAFCIGATSVILIDTLLIAQVITLETIGANCYHLSLLANTEDPIGQGCIPNDVLVSARPALAPDAKVRSRWFLQAFCLISATREPKCP